MPSNFLTNASINPLMLPWTDLGLRTLEAMVATGQQMSEQVDRIARATAAEPTEELVEEAEQVAQPLTVSSLAALGQLQAASFQWITQAWQQWFNAFAGFNPMRLLQADEAEEKPAQPWLFSAMPSPVATAKPQRATRRAREASHALEFEHAAAEAGKQRRPRSRSKNAHSRASRSK